MASQQRHWSGRIWVHFLVLLIQVVAVVTHVNADDELPSSLDSVLGYNEESVDDLFQPSSTYSVLGPNTFPKPSDMVSRDAVIVLEPSIGKHRPEKDAVLAYAEGYPLENYLIFIESLARTGFDGDIVLAVASMDTLSEGVEDYLRTKTSVVVYAMEFVCSDNGFVSTLNRTQDGGAKMSFQMCKLDGIYGTVGEDGTTVHPQPDPRKGRVVATSRYEIYWIWAQQYSKHSWLMLLDARDAYFQRNPFENLPRTTDPNVNSGILYFFGENTNQTRLGKSPKNRKWLERAYSVGVMEYLRDKPTICSGSTMGEQVALEAYLRAMVNEWDETHILMKGADQGFHNYLYYTNKLLHLNAIRSIKVFVQGRGIINNLGALRKLKLQQLKVYNNRTREIYNWDGMLSPVVHQWDRDKALFNFIDGSLLPSYKKQWYEYYKTIKVEQQ